jgi:hypothetical protein
VEVAFVVSIYPHFQPSIHSTSILKLFVDAHLFLSYSYARLNRSRTMQTLNVGAGRTDEEYKAAEEQRRADLLADGKGAANYFFAAAVMAALGTGVLPLRINVGTSIGTIDLLALYGGGLARHSLVLWLASALWVVTLLLLAVAARKGNRWAFLVGVVLYAADMVPLAITLSVWSIGVHGFFVFKWFEGQKALRDAQPDTVSQ